MSRASTSLPVPVSPVISTGRSLLAIRRATAATFSISSAMNTPSALPTGAGGSNEACCRCSRLPASSSTAASTSLRTASSASRDPTSDRGDTARKNRRPRASPRGTRLPGRFPRAARPASDRFQPCCASTSSGRPSRATTSAAPCAHSRSLTSESASRPSSSGLVDSSRTAAASVTPGGVGFANTIYLGLAEPVYGPITPGNETWFLSDLPTYDYDPQLAVELLEGLGLVDRDGDGFREDGGGRPARFTLLTQQGNTSREMAAQVLQADLARMGIGVDVVPLEFGALIERVSAMDFDAAYIGFRASDTDPATNLDFWLSSAAFHVWNPNQPTPATEWEREIDERMGRLLQEVDHERRLDLFDEVQILFAENLPALYFAAPRLSVATSARMANIEPSLLAPHVLWSADTLAVRRAQ